MKYFILILTVIIMFSCKEEHKELEVCFQIDENEINQGDSVLFTNCSVADSTLIVIQNADNNQVYNGPAYNFVNDSIYITFSDTGNFIAVVRAWNFEQGTEMKRFFRTIRVN
ncbi:MAG: hypothetical protein R2799_09665 [Crocinitomicaceae bacterium]